MQVKNSQLNFIFILSKCVLCAGCRFINNRRVKIILIAGAAKPFTFCVGWVLNAPKGENIDRF